MSARTSHSVLADRIAANLIHHEPGWRLPRQSALARRFNASTTQIDAALDELVGRHLIRRLPDGQLYRASPADYLIRLEGMPGLDSHIDPMGAVITCRSFRLSSRRAPEKIALALGIKSQSVCVARLTWTANGQPAALVTTYLTSPPPGLAMGEQPTSPATALTVLPPALTGPNGRDERADGTGPFAVRAVSVEMLPPLPSVARTLRLPAGASATLITARFDDTTTGTPAALTVVVLHPDLFRIALEWSDGSKDAHGPWAPALEDAEP
jgi:Bacterial regulatory proteins, gntR family